MTIQHKSIPEDGLHEPKGVSTAASKRVYRSDGAGSGTWSQVDADTLTGTITNSSVEGLRVETDGSGGFKAVLAPASAFGTMNLTDNATFQALTAAADATLNNNADFVALSPVLEYDSVQNMTTGSNSLTVQNAGLYAIDFWCGVSSSVSATKFSLKFVINDTTFVARGPKLTTQNANIVSNLSANGIHTFSAGDTVKLYIAADKNCNIIIEDLTFQMLYLGGV